MLMYFSGLTIQQVFLTSWTCFYHSYDQINQQTEKANFVTAEHKIFNPLSLTRQNVIEPPVKARVVVTLLSTYLTTFLRAQGFPHSSDGKESACGAGDLASVPGSGRSPGEGNGTHSSVLAWKVPWTEEPGGLQSMGSQGVGHHWATYICNTCTLRAQKFKTFSPNPSRESPFQEDAPALMNSPCTSLLAPGPYTTVWATNIQRENIDLWSQASHSLNSRVLFCPWCGDDNVYPL